MKILRALILADTILLATLGFWMLFHPHSLPVVYAEGKPYQEMATLRVLGIALGGLATVLFVLSADSLVGDRRRLALWLSGANGLVAMMAFIQQHAIWGSAAGWLLVTVFLGMAVALAWAGWRPLKPEEIAAEVATLQIPPEIREVLLRQIGETAAQEERNRLARDLHDSIKQQLFTINVSTAAAQELWGLNPERAKAALGDVRRSAREAMVEMQALLHQLQPRALDSAGLVEALREQCEALGYRTGAEVALELGEAIPDDRLAPGAQEALFRIAQEALANVARHARARNVRVWLGLAGDSTELRVEDDGLGFAPGSGNAGMGLSNMRQRASSVGGSLDISSPPGGGTAVVVSLPLLDPPPAREPRFEKAIRKEREELALAVLLGAVLVPKAGAAEMTFWGALLAFCFLGGTLWSRRRERSTLAASRDAAPADATRLRFAGHQCRAFQSLFAAWWALWLGSLADGQAERLAWATMAVLCGAVMVFELLSLLRESQFRSTFPAGVWKALSPVARVTFLVAGLASGVAFFVPERAARLTPVQVLFFVLGLALLASFPMREPRTQRLGR